MSVFFTADCHFGHKNIINYVNRPFKDVNEMDDELIDRWNSRVKSGDDIYCLGDFTLGDNAVKYFSWLNGSIHIIPGGHDWRWLEKFSYTDKVKIMPPLVTLSAVSSEVPAIVLCHYPMLSWDKSHYGSINLHGHVHSNGESISIYDKRLDVGVDAHDFYPISLKEVLDIFKRK